MPNLKISQLPNAGTLQDADLLAVVQSSGPELVTAKTTVGALRSGSGGGSGASYEVLDSLQNRRNGYAEFLSKKNTATLTPGAKYVFKFRTLYKDRGLNADTSGAGGKV